MSHRRSMTHCRYMTQSAGIFVESSRPFNSQLFSVVLYPSLSVLSFFNTSSNPDPEMLSLPTELQVFSEASIPILTPRLAETSCKSIRRMPFCQHHYHCCHQFYPLSSEYQITSITVNCYIRCYSTSNLAFLSLIQYIRYRSHVLIVSVFTRRIVVC